MKRDIMDMLLDSDNDSDTELARARPRTSQPTTPQASASQQPAVESDVVLPVTAVEATGAQSSSQAAASHQVEAASAPVPRGELPALAASMGMRPDEAEAFLGNIGVAVELPPVLHQEPFRIVPQRDWRFLPKNRMEAILAEGRRIVGNRNDVRWDRFMCDTQSPQELVRQLENRVESVAQEWSFNYIGVTENILWRWEQCTDQRPGMVAHRDNGQTHMYVLSANFGKGICALEKHLIDYLQAKPAEVRKVNMNGWTYRTGKILEARIYFLYMVVH